MRESRKGLGGGVKKRERILLSRLYTQESLTWDSIPRPEIMTRTKNQEMDP